MLCRGKHLIHAKICFVAVAFVLIFGNAVGVDKQKKSATLNGTTEAIRIVWSGTKHPNGIVSGNVATTCEFGGYPICCAAMVDEKEGDLISSRNANISLLSMHHNHRFHCALDRVYIPSSYEVNHIERAFVINQLKSEDDRRKQYLDFLFSSAEINAAKRWLARVKIHGSTDLSPVITSDDYELMSRFEVTRTCPHVSAGGVHSNVSVSWLEWIEPLSMHARHPFAIGNCSRLKSHGIDLSSVFAANNLSNTRVQRIDYILFQSAASQYSHTTLHMGQRTSRPVRHYLLDAGTSLFDSSLRWFVCAYQQIGMAFDQIFGWEMTLLDPRVFWSKVPPKYKSIYHFFNVPVQKASGDSDSPLHVIMTEATRDDFVSFKLDIDTPEVEIPIALQIANDPELAALIDEFFFELHFRCEWMMHCGWGDKMPKEVNGLKLDRPHAMEFFQNMRKRGIRAHFWP